MNEITYKDTYKLHEYMSIYDAILLSKLRFRFYHLFIIMVLFSLHGYLIAITKQVHSSFLLLSLGIPVLFLFVFVLYPKIIKKQLKKAFYTNRTLQEEMVITINDNGVRQETLDVNSLFRWEHMHKAYELNEWFVLFIATNQFIMLRKSNRYKEGVRQKLTAVLGEKKFKQR